MGYEQQGFMAQIWYIIKWKIFHRRKCRGGIIPKRPKPLSGRKLEREALREYGIRRQPGETDEELRARIMAKVENEYIGSVVVPHDELRDILKGQIAATFKIPAEAMQQKPKPLSGRDLDIYARDIDGLTRKTGETDEQLRRRCMAVEVERCYGGVELTINEGECENE